MGKGSLAGFEKRVLLKSERRTFLLGLMVFSCGPDGDALRTTARRRGRRRRRRREGGGGGMMVGLSFFAYSTRSCTQGNAPYLTFWNPLPRGTEDITICQSFLNTKPKNQKFSLVKLFFSSSVHSIFLFKLIYDCVVYILH